ncbi:MAG: hypothetical protein AB1689_21230, partial [Thermodesulfobacteriota bacterium]
MKAKRAPIEGLYVANQFGAEPAIDVVQGPALVRDPPEGAQHVAAETKARVRAPRRLARRLDDSHAVARELPRPAACD